MASINIFKINSDPQISQAFDNLLNKFRIVGTPKPINNPSGKTYKVTLYTGETKQKKELSWKWAFDEFEKQAPTPPTQPKGILVVESEEFRYCVTFGSSFISVDAYCEREFGFNFAKKLHILETKTATKVSPGLATNKTINTYLNQQELDHESNEAFAKIKLVCDQPSQSTLYRPTISIGQSIRFETQNNPCTLQIVTQLIEHVESYIKNQPDITSIPVFQEIKDKSITKRLDDILIQGILEGTATISNPELSVYGATEILNNTDQKFLLKSGRHRWEVTEINIQTLKELCEKFGLNFDKEVLNFNVEFFNQDECVKSTKIKTLIDFICDDESSVLSNGKWYRYNTDFFEYLDREIAQLDVEYKPEADFSEEKRKDFIDQKIFDLKDDPKFKNKSEEEIRSQLTKSQYNELVFNCLRERDHYTLLDRNLSVIHGHKFEMADLKKDGMLIAVKMGNGSAKLSYAIDQSISSMKLYRNDKKLISDEITTFALWFVLKHSHIEGDDNIPDLRKLKMLSLKMKIIDWVKTVKKYNFQPKIFISYMQ